MSSRRSKACVGLPLVISALLLACGGDPPVVAPPPKPTPTAEPVAVVPSAAPSATPETPPAGSAQPDASAPKPKSGRPPILKSDPAEISDTFGSTPAAKLEIGEKDIAFLKIPEGALERATNITFKLDPKGKSTGVPIGKVYRISVVVPPSPNFQRVTSLAEPFELHFPAGDKKNANLAIGDITGEVGKEKVAWTIVAPTKIDDATGTAFFDLPAIGGETYVHITAKAVSGPPPEKPEKKP